MKKAITIMVCMVALNIGCGASFVDVVRTTLTIVTDAIIILDQIERYVDIYFEKHEVKDPNLKPTLDSLIARCRSAIDLVARLAYAGRAWDSDDITTALKEFEAAFIDLMALIEPLGIHVEGWPASPYLDRSLVVVQRPLALRPLAVRAKDFE